MQLSDEGSSQLRGSSKKETYFLSKPTVTKESKQQSGEQEETFLFLVSGSRPLQMMNIDVNYFPGTLQELRRMQQCDK